MSRILVFMSDNRALQPDFEKADYNSLVASINAEYCKKYGYDFIYYRPCIGKEFNLMNCKNLITGALRHASWAKLLSTSVALQGGYDYVVYIDSDCIFKDSNESLENFIKPHASRDFIFLNNKPWGDDMPCAGFYICKVNHSTKRFLSYWYNYANVPEKDYSHPWEQDSLWQIFRGYQNLVILDLWSFQEKDQQYIRHVSCAEGERRMNYFRTGVHNRGIDYETVIKGIRVVEYDTLTVTS